MKDYELVYTVTSIILKVSDKESLPSKVFLMQMIKHPLTDAGIEKFMAD